MTTSATTQYEVLDEHGLPTGQILDRETVHKDQLWHAVVNVWIINSKNELLMQLRAPGADLFPNVWDVSIGTHLQPQESPVVAALRCLQTELGVSATTEKLEHLFNVQSANPMANNTFHKVLGHVFLLQQDLNLVDVHVDPAKISRLEWVPLTKVMSEIGNDETKSQYLPRANNYYPQLFEALQNYLF